jgi:hypothetical protein
MQLPDIPPAAILSLLVGVLCTALYVVIRGTGHARLIFVLIAAVLGAWAGQAVGSRLGDPLRIGDFALLSAFLVAWLGIAVVAVASTLGGGRDRDDTARRTRGHG